MVELIPGEGRHINGLFGLVVFIHMMFFLPSRLAFVIKCLLRYRRRIAGNFIVSLVFDFFFKNHITNTSSLFAVARSLQYASEALRETITDNCGWRCF